MYQSYARGNLYPYGAVKKSPLKNHRQYALKEQSSKIKGYSTVMRSNGKMLAHFGSEPEFESYERSIEKYNEKVIAMLAQDRNSRYKTEMCRNFKERAYCIYGNQCQFAHGRDELRDALRNNKYKTKSCQKYWMTGYCAYGPRCNFVHLENGEIESQLDSAMNIDINNDQMLSAQSTSSLSSELGKSPVTSDEELAETVEDVITTGRAILSQMERNKSFCDPKLEVLFEKLKRALPPKRSSTPLLHVSNSTESSFEVSRNSPLEFEKKADSSSLSDLHGNSSYGNLHQNGTIFNQNSNAEAEMEPKYDQFGINTERVEGKEMEQTVKRDIFSVISICSKENASPNSKST